MYVQNPGRKSEKPGRKSEKFGRNSKILEEIQKTWKKFPKFFWPPCIYKLAHIKCQFFRIRMAVHMDSMEEIFSNLILLIVKYALPHYLFVL